LLGLCGNVSEPDEQYCGLMIKLDREAAADHGPPHQDDLQDEVRAGRLSLQLRHERLGRER
jgi:hypothetical protein